MWRYDSCFKEEMKTKKPPGKKFDDDEVSVKRCGLKSL